MTEIRTSLEEESDPGTTPDEISALAVQSFEGAPDARLRQLLQGLAAHLHAFAIETALTDEEWQQGIRFLTAAGQACTPTRQELILLSDTLGLSMVLDAVHHAGGDAATESTVLGPFYVPDSPARQMGESIVEDPGSGSPARVSGRVSDLAGRPIAGAVLDVWQNSATGRYAVQDTAQQPTNLRGRFVTGADGTFCFWSVRPTDYPIPDDGPVGDMLRATGRHPWRPAHLHLIVSAPGYGSVATHLFDDESKYLESDVVFGVKPSLICHYDRHDPGDPPGPDAPAGIDGPWYSLERTIRLRPVGPGSHTPG